MVRCITYHRFLSLSSLLSQRGYEYVHVQYTCKQNNKITVLYISDVEPLSWNVSSQLAFSPRQPLPTYPLIPEPQLALFDATKLQ